MLRADDELPVVLGKLILAFDCIGNLKLMLMRSKIRERALLGVPKDHRGSSKRTNFSLKQWLQLCHCVHWELRAIAASLGEDAS